MGVINKKGITVGSEKQSFVSLTFIFLVVISFLGCINGNGLHNGVAILVEASGGSAAFSGLITSVFSLTALISRFVAGPLSDGKGRKVTMGIGAAVMALGCVFAVATSSLAMLFPSRLLMGIGFSLVTTANIAAIADVVPASRLGSAIGYQGLAYALGMAAGPGFAVALAHMGRMETFSTFGLACCLCLILILTCKLPPAPKVQIEPEGDFKRSEKTSGSPLGNFIFSYVEYASLRPAIVIMLVYVPMTFYMTFMSLYAEELKLPDSELYFVIAAVVMVVIRLVFSNMFDRCHVNLLLLPALAVGAVGFVVPMIMGDAMGLYISGFCYGVYCGFAQPLLTTDALRRAPVERRGAASATYNIGCDVGVIISSTVWGLLISVLGYSLSFLIAAVFVCATALAAVFLLRVN